MHLFLGCVVDVRRQLFPSAPFSKPDFGFQTFIGDLLSCIRDKNIPLQNMHFVVWMHWPSLANKFKVTGARYGILIYCFLGCCDLHHLKSNCQKLMGEGNSSINYLIEFEFDFVEYVLKGISSIRRFMIWERKLQNPKSLWRKDLDALEGQLDVWLKN